MPVIQVGKLVYTLISTNENVVMWPVQKAKKRKVRGLWRQCWEDWSRKVISLKWDTWDLKILAVSSL